MNFGNIINCQSCEELCELVSSEKYDVISFDLFDTLIPRVGRPNTLLKLCSKIIGDSFESYACKRKYGGKWWKIVDDCETSIAGCIDDRIVCRNKEIELEIDFAHARKSLKKVFSAALSAKKKVVVTSDMYLPKDVIEKILYDNGYVGIKQLYLSDRGKKNGSSYKHIVKDFPNSKILHIGDNYEVDCQGAVKWGIDSLHVKSCFDLFKESDLGKQFKATNVSDELIQGMLSCILFDDPFVHYHSSLNDSISNLGYLFGAFYSSFIIWLLKQLKQRNIDKLYLIRRDDELFSKMISMTVPYYTSPECVSIELSRLIRSYKMIKCDGILTLCKYRPYAYLSNHLFVDDPQVKSLIKDIQRKEVLELTDENIDLLERKLNREKINYNCEMLDQYVSNLFSNQKSAIFDNSLTGSAYYFLKKYYAAITENLVEFSIYGPLLSSNIINYVNTNEKIIPSITDASIKSSSKKAIQFDKKDPNTFVYGKIPKIWTNREYVQHVILNFYNQFLDVFGKYIDYIDVNPQFVWGPLVKIWNTDNENDKYLISFYLSNDNQMVSSKRIQGSSSSNDSIHFSNSIKSDIISENNSMDQLFLSKRFKTNSVNELI